MNVLPLSRAIEAFLVPWQGMDWPIDWADVFGREGPVVVEIGFGNGAFIADLAAQSPETNFIGIERSWGSVQRLFRRTEALPEQNIRIAQGDAAFLLDKLFAPGALDGLYINFPDPWHKERHYGRRLIQPGFLDLVSRRLRPGADVTIATDHADYAAWIRDALEGQTKLTPRYGTTEVEAIAGRRPTKYEGKAIAKGIPIHYYVWSWQGRTTDDVVSEKIEDMPNVILEGPCSPDAVIEAFRQRAWHVEHDGVTVVAKLLDIYKQQEDGHLLIETMVREDGFSQHFGVSVVFRSPTSALVKLSAIGYPRPTYGVKQAVRLAADLVREACPETTVQSSNIATSDTAVEGAG